MWRFVTLMPTGTGKWNPNWSIGYMRTRKSASILEEYLMWNGEHSPHWFLRQRVGWGNNALGSLSIGRAHCLKERRAIFLSHLLGKSPSFVCAFAIGPCLLKRLQEHQSSAWHEKQSHWYWRCWRSHLLGLFIVNFYISQYLTSWLKSKTSRKVQTTG